MAESAFEEAMRAEAHAIRKLRADLESERTARREAERERDEYKDAGWRLAEDYAKATRKLESANWLILDAERERYGSSGVKFLEWLLAEARWERDEAIEARRQAEAIERHHEECP